MLKLYSKQDYDAHHRPPHNIVLLQFDFNIKFPLLRLLQYLSDLKSTNLFMNSKIQFMFFKFFI